MNAIRYDNSLQEPTKAQYRESIHNYLKVRRSIPDASLKEASSSSRSVLATTLDTAENVILRAFYGPKQDYLKEAISYEKIIHDQKREKLRSYISWRKHIQTPLLTQATQRKPFFKALITKGLGFLDQSRDMLEQGKLALTHAVSRGSEVAHESFKRVNGVLQSGREIKSACLSYINERAHQISCKLGTDCRIGNVSELNGTPGVETFSLSTGAGKKTSQIYFLMDKGPYADSLKHAIDRGDIEEVRMLPEYACFPEQMADTEKQAEYIPLLQVRMKGAKTFAPMMDSLQSYMGIKKPKRSIFAQELETTEPEGALSLSPS